MYRIIACDLDETLLNSEHQVSQNDIETIKKLASEGVRFVLASGRGFNSMFELMKQLDLYEQEGEYTISFNGAVITENKNNRLLHFDGLDYEKAAALYRFGVEKGLCVHLYTLDDVYIYNYIPEERKYVEGRMPIIEYFRKDIEEFRDTPITKVLYMDPDMEKLKKLEPEMAGMLEGIQLSYSSNRYMEFNHEGVSKGLGMKQLARILNVDISETMAVGDHLNDLSMIREAGLGVAVNNAVAEVKKECGLVLEGTNNDSPITEIYEKCYRMR